MNGNSYVVDTNVILFLLKGDEKVSHILQDKHVYLSFITELELLSFKELIPYELSQIKNFLGECIIIDVNSDIKDSAIKLRRDYNIKLPDAIIAATSQFLQVPLLTSDRGFRKTKELEILFYEK